MRAESFIVLSLAVLASIQYAISVNQIRREARGEGGDQLINSCSNPVQMWTRHAFHLESPRAFSMPRIRVDGLSTTALAERCAAAGTPVLIQGLMDLPEWQSAMNQLANRSALLAAFGDEEVHLSLSQFLTPGPEGSSQQLSQAKLEFMRQQWIVDGSTFRDGLLQQVQEGNPMPRVQLKAWMQALQDNAAPPDAYVFCNVSGTAIAATVGPL